jgi:hypothetical protein
MSHHPDLLGTIGLYLGTKKLLTRDTILGWAKEDLPSGGFLTLSRIRDGKAWIIEAYTCTTDFCPRASQRWRVHKLPDDLLVFFDGFPTISQAIPPTE